MMTRTPISLVALFCISCGGPTATNPADPAANREAVELCSSGNADACALAGMSEWLDVQAKDGNPNSSLKAFLSGCELNDWFACAMAGSIQASAADGTSIPKKAYGLALAACEGENDAGACAYLGNWAAKGDAKDEAKKHYSLACRLTMSADTREDDLAEFSCKRAVEFGALATDLQPAANPDGGKKAKRISGQERIGPPAKEVTKMARMGVKQIGAKVVLCLSETGTPRKIFFAQFSEFPLWNQKIFETIRQWRYSPAIDADGTPVPVCKSVTFIYVASR